MTGPIIPADQWPEDAALHTWDEENGQGYWTVYDKIGGFWTIRSSEIPMPDGWDWRVPVMREQSPAIDLEQFRVAAEAYKFEGKCKLLEFCFGPEADKQAAIAQIADGDRLLALIDGSKNNNLSHVGDINVVVSQSSKGEGE